VLICESLDPYNTDNPDHLSYQKANRTKGRMGGQVKIRARYRSHVGKWFDYLLVSRKEMIEIVKGTGWKVDQFIGSSKSHNSLYIGIIRKRT
jgi:hypothetical protein